MSVNTPSPYGRTPFVVGGLSTANTSLATTVPADPSTTATGRQAVITSITVRSINDSSSAIAGSAMIQPTLTNTQNAATGAATTVTYAMGNALAAWTDRYILQEYYGDAGLPIVAGSNGVFTVPALGANVIAQVVITGFYV